MSFALQQTGPSDLTVLDDSGPVAQIRALQLTLARFRRGGSVLIGETVPLPLYWRQYANHQDPERSACTDPMVTPVTVTGDAVVLECSGKTASGACHSRVRLAIRNDGRRGAYVYTVKARLDVLNRWRVTPNPDHGEVEFANLWPEKTFDPARDVQKRYQACYHVSGRDVERIPHHHLESSDKRNILLRPGDRFLWLKEEENLCLTLVSPDEVTAGVCAYMWDAHFAYKVCRGGKEVWLPAGECFAAEYELTAMPGSEAEAIVRAARDRASPERHTTPIVVDGVNRFSETLDEARGDLRYIWPWEQEGGEGATLSVDRSAGFDDSTSLRIDRVGPGSACWKATTLGPAFGGNRFPHSARYRFSARVKTSRLDGASSIAVRYHREGAEDLYNPAGYETVISPRSLSGESEWTLLEVITSVVSPAPDRFHLLLLQQGSGTTWFDNAHFEVLP